MARRPVDGAPFCLVLLGIALFPPPPSLQVRLLSALGPPPSPPSPTEPEPEPESRTVGRGRSAVVSWVGVFPRRLAEGSRG